MPSTRESWRLRQTDCAYIGNLDADISFGERYFETLIERFESDSKLGVIGGRIFEIERSRPAARGKEEHGKRGRRRSVLSQRVL